MTHDTTSVIGSHDPLAPDEGTAFLAGVLNEHPPRKTSFLDVDSPRSRTVDRQLILVQTRFWSYRLCLYEVALALALSTPA